MLPDFVQTQAWEKECQWHIDWVGFTKNRWGASRLIGWLCAILWLRIIIVGRIGVDAGGSNRNRNRNRLTTSPCRIALSVGDVAGAYLRNAAAGLSELSGMKGKALHLTFTAKNLSSYSVCLVLIWFSNYVALACRATCDVFLSIWTSPR